jgi:hypothetical protein
VEHTLGGAGVLFDEKSLAEVGEMAHLLATDGALRAACLRTQALRLPDLSPAAVLAKLRGFIESL